MEEKYIINKEEMEYIRMNKPRPQIRYGVLELSTSDILKLTLIIFWVLYLLAGILLFPSEMWALLLSLDPTFHPIFLYVLALVLLKYLCMLFWLLLLIRDKPVFGGNTTISYIVYGVVLLFFTVTIIIVIVGINKDTGGIGTLFTNPIFYNYLLFTICAVLAIIIDALYVPPTPTYYYIPTNNNNNTPFNAPQIVYSALPLSTPTIPMPMPIPMANYPLTTLY